MLPPGLRLLLCFGVAATVAKEQRKPSRHFPTPPDTRPPGCDAEAVDTAGRSFEDLRVSIIIPYRNERWDHIKSSLASVLYYTPKRYLVEILLVSDGNTNETSYIKELHSLSKVISLLVIPPPGAGLIAAKMRAVGAAALESSVLVFLEPHIRVNRNWLEPLLARIRKYPKVLAMPVLDFIPVDDFKSYHPAGPGHWRFEWNLNLIFTNADERSSVPSAPYLTPATSGGIFAIRKDWWTELSFYDSGMLGWGGDHIEATFKVWRCGGHIEMVPCSRIGHLFRQPSHRPYKVEIDQVVRNYKRIAVTWLDEYLDTFYIVKPEARGMDAGNVTAALALRERLGCKSMSWFLKHVDTEMGWEKDHVCIPGCTKAQSHTCCDGQAAFGRSTLDKVMPPRQFKPLPNPDDVKAVRAIHNEL